MGAGMALDRRTLIGTALLMVPAAAAAAIEQGGPGIDLARLSARVDFAPGSGAARLAFARGWASADGGRRVGATMVEARRATADGRILVSRAISLDDRRRAITLRVDEEESRAERSTPWTREGRIWVRRREHRRDGFCVANGTFDYCAGEEFLLRRRTAERIDPTSIGDNGPVDPLGTVHEVARWTPWQGGVGERRLDIALRSIRPSELDRPFPPSSASIPASESVVHYEAIHAFLSA